MVNNHFRVAAYHPAEDITVLIDSYGVYDKLWQLSSTLVMKGFKIIEASDSSKFVEVNIPSIEPNDKQLYLRACMVGKPDEFLQIIDAKRLKVLQVENRMYIPDKNTTI